MPKSKPGLSGSPRNAKKAEADFVKKAARLTLDDPAVTNYAIALLLGATSYTADGVDPCEFIGFLPGVVEGQDFLAFRDGAYLYVIQTPPSPIELARSIARGPKYGLAE